MAKVKRSQIQTFINTVPTNPHVLASPSVGAQYFVIGPGVPTGEVNMNPKTTSEQYIGDDTGSTSVDNYAPTFPVEHTAIVDDPVFDFVDQLRLDRAILGAAETDIVNVWMSLVDLQLTLLNSRRCPSRLRTLVMLVATR
jgi:hypothetical protein